MLKLVTWNCAMALHKKHEKLLSLGGDILVIQECSREFIKQIGRTDGWSSAWFGKNRNKGLGVLVKSPWTIRNARALKIKWAAKLTIAGPLPIELYPIWACVGARRADAYIGQVHRLLDIIEKSSLHPSTIVAGDFNSNSFWDKKDGIKNHSAAVERFRRLGMQSAYHSASDVSHGAELHPTLWFTKNKKKAYHIDYAFLSRRLLSKVKRVEVGHSDHWISFSDHAPVLVELDL
jgi:exodeoxyribonuclease-3